jgi:hypothetical protein
MTLLATSYIQHVEEATWLSLIMVVPKKNEKLKICVDFKKVNATMKKDPFSLPITNEVLNIVARCEAYSFLDGYYGYHQISIALEDRYKTTFVTNWGVFIWRVMFFGVKNGPPTFQRVVTKAFIEYLDNFMNIFLDDFTIHSGMETHLQNLRLCFQKCKEYKISLNP